MSILERFKYQRKLFDLNDKADVKCYKEFYETRRWGPTGCPFFLEEPYLSVPSMINDKILKKFLDIKE